MNPIPFPADSGDPWSLWMERTQDLVAHLDPQGVPLHLGRGFRRILPEGKDPAFLMSPPSPWRQALRRVRDTLRPVRRTLKVRTREDLREMEFLFLPLEREGSLSGILAQGRDVTELRRLRRDRQKGRDLENLGYLASGVVHDLNNLFAVVLNSLDLAERRLPGDLAGQPDLARARRGALRARDLTGSVLRQVRGQPRERFLFPPTVTLEELLDFLSTLKKGATLALAASPEAHRALVRGTPEEVARLALNLCVNALQALEGRAGRVDLDCSVRDLSVPEARARGLRDGGWAFLLTVRDDGPGLPREVRDRIFRDRVSARPGGTGLGLGLVRDLARDLEGDVEVLSVPGRGTAFTVALPVRDWTDPVPPLTAPAPRGTERIGTLLLPPWGSFYGGLLASWGYEVVPFESASALVRQVSERSGRPDLLLLDRGVPEAEPLSRTLAARGIRTLWGDRTSGEGDFRLPASRTELARALHLTLKGDRV